MTSSGFPVPLPDADTRAFWEGSARGELLVPRCGACGHWIWQPKPVCPRCRVPEPVWTPVDGAARIVSWTVIHPPVLPAYEELVPFAVVLVELDAAPGVRMVGPLVDPAGAIVTVEGAPEGVATGAAVALVWRDQEGWVIPAWSATT